MGRKLLYGEQTTVISFKVPISKKEHLKQEIKTLINDELNHKENAMNNEYEEFKAITRQLLLGESIKKEEMEWLLQKCQL